MQKIKISKKNLLDAIAEFALLQSSVRYIHFSFDDTDIPDFIEVKGELLEGGTVECLCNYGKHTRNDCQRYRDARKVTMEKCCEYCTTINDRGVIKRTKDCLDVECPGCHNKKEELKKHSDGSVCDCQFYGHECTHKDFNRETPKEKIAIVPSGRIDYCVKCDAEHGYHCPTEEKGWKIVSIGVSPTRKK